MRYSSILLEVRDHIATVILNRPAKLNALNLELLCDLDEVLAELDGKDEVRVIVVTGAGRAFCAGADLSDHPDAAARAEMRKILDRGGLIRPWNMKKPVIAAINGPAVGGGITLAMRWDFRVAAESARIGFVFVRRGAVPELLATWLLPRIVGLGRANELLLSGRILSAREALDYGIVNHVWPDTEFIPRVRELAADMARNAAPVSVAVTKRLIYGQLCESSPDKAYAAESRAFWWAGQQEDVAEGARSFLEKRAPDWKLKPSRDFPDFLKPIE